MNAAPKPVVAFKRKVAAPRPPKTVESAPPPKALPPARPPPFAACMSTIRTSTTQTMT